MVKYKNSTYNKYLKEIYCRLYSHYGPQHWWPGDTRFEIIVGAILTQNTNWTNVSKAISNLRKANVLTQNKLDSLPQDKLAQLIRPSGYYNIKAQRLKNFLGFLFKRYGGNLDKMFDNDLEELRQEILGVKGIGPETADSILLYAGSFPIFVVDAYTKRIFSRHKLFKENADYSDVQKIFMQNIKKDVKLYNEYHALIVRLGKDICRKNNPRCDICPLDKFK